MEILKIGDEVVFGKRSCGEITDIQEKRGLVSIKTGVDANETAH